MNYHKPFDSQECNLDIFLGVSFRKLVKRLKICTELITAPYTDTVMLVKHVGGSNPRLSHTTR